MALSLLLTLLLAAFGSGANDAPSSSGPPPPHDLKVEHLTAGQALGLDSELPRFAWSLSHPARGQKQAAYRIVVTSALKTTPGLVWDSGKVNSSQSEGVAFASSNGTTASIAADQPYLVQVMWWDIQGRSSAWSEALPFSTGLFRTADWQGAEWLAATCQRGGGVTKTCASQLRTEFQLDTDAFFAQLHVGSQGYHRCLINGIPVSDHRLGHQTTAERRILYDTFNVTSLLRPGANALGCLVADGFYGKTHQGASLSRGIIALLSVHNADGSHHTVTSTTSAQQPWTLANGPFLQAEVFEGVVYDTARETPGWALPGFHPAPSVPWQQATSLQGAPQGVLRAAMTPLIRATLEVKPTGMSRLSESSYMYDFGRNAAATLRVALPIAPLQNIVYTLAITCTETLTSPSQLGPRLNNGVMSFRFSWKPPGREPSPQENLFSYAGFRFCQANLSASAMGDPVAAPLVTPLPALANSSLTMLLTHSDVQDAGQVTFSSPLLNAIQEATLASSLSNLMDVPTDCPTRERAGWTGDGQLTHRTRAYNHDMAAFYTKWLHDMVDSQATYRQECEAASGCECETFNCTGEIPPACPFYGHGYHGSASTRKSPGYPGTDPVWGAAFVVISHHMLQWHADTRLVGELYPHLRLYMEYLAKLPAVNSTGLLTYNVYNDWDRPNGHNPGPPLASRRPLSGVESHVVPVPVPGPRGTPSPLLSSYTYVRELGMMAEMALALGHDADAQAYSSQMRRAATVFRLAYLRNGTSFADGGPLPSESAQALGLALFSSTTGLESLLSASERSAVIATLVASIRGRAGHSYAGITGQERLFPVCSQYTQRVAEEAADPKAPSLAALALQMNIQTSYPSFGYEVASGATTLWEKFEGVGGTRNHIMFGTQSAWYYDSLAGIQMGGRASAHGSAWTTVRLHPKVTCEYLTRLLNLTSVNASIHTPRGRVASSWRLHSCPSSSPPPPELPSCGSVTEKDHKYHPNSTGILTLGCGLGRSIAGVAFADFGVPEGDCVAGFRANMSCSANRSLEIVKELCLSKPECTVPATVQTFGDPCLGVPKRLAVRLTCGPSPAPPAPPGARALDWNITVPVGSDATVTVPLLGGDAATASVYLSTTNGTFTIAWGSGRFLPGGVSVSGVSGGRQVDDGIQFQCGSGSYSWRLRGG